MPAAGLITHSESRSLRLAIDPDSLPDAAGKFKASASPVGIADGCPTIALWNENQGQVALGAAFPERPMATAMHEDGLGWQSETDYASLDDLLADLEAGIGR